MSIRRIAGLALAVAACLLCAGPVGSQVQRVTPYVLFNGSDIDSLEHASQWIPVKGATRVIIKTTSTHLVFAVTAADSMTSDSIGVFKVALSDSLGGEIHLDADTVKSNTTTGSFTIGCTTARFGNVVAGMHVYGTGIPDRTYVTDATSTSEIGISRAATATGLVVLSFGTDKYLSPFCADSVVITASGRKVVDADTLYKQVGLYGAPILLPLRTATNGSGINTYLFPTNPALTTLDPSGVILAGYLRVLVTPARRNTADGGQSTAGHRVNGLKGLRMIAYVYFNNQ